MKTPAARPLLALAFLLPPAAAAAQPPPPPPPAVTFPWPGVYYPITGLYEVPTGGVVCVLQLTATGWQLIGVRPL